MYQNVRGDAMSNIPETFTVLEDAKALKLHTYTVRRLVRERKNSGNKNRRTAAI